MLPVVPQVIQTGKASFYTNVCISAGFKVLILILILHIEEQSDPAPI